MNSREVLLHPSCTQIRGFLVLGVALLYWRQRRRVLLGGRTVEPSDSECCSGTDKDDIMISYGKRRRRGPVCRTKYRERSKGTAAGACSAAWTEHGGKSPGDSPKCCERTRCCCRRSWHGNRLAVR